MEGELETSAAGRRGSLWRRALGRLGVQFGPGEARPALLLFCVFFLLITFQYTTKSVRQSTFINSLGAEKLPYVYLFIALVSYPFLRLYSRFADAMRRDSLIAATCAFTGLTMVLFWWWFEWTWTWVPFAFYVWISISIVMLVSQFWSFSNHMFDARQAKRLFAFVGAGGLLGGIFGGQVAKLATKFVGTRYALLVAAALLFSVVALIWLARRLHPVDERRVAGAAGLASLNEARGGFELLRQSLHLRWVAAIMLLTVVVAQIVDLQFNWAVQQATTSLDQRTAFFGNFYSAMGIMAFVFQLLFTARIHRGLGVGFAMRVLPFSMGLGTVALIMAALVAPELLLAAALVLKTSENGVRYSLDQATRELLYLPIPSRARVKAKAFIDVFVQRAAKGVAALLLLPVTFAWLTPPQTGWMSLALIVVWLGTTVAARRQYIESFRAGLKKQIVDPGVIDLNDATALELIVQSLGSPDERQVIHALDLLQRQEKAKLIPPLLLYHQSAAVRRTVLRVLPEDRGDALPLVERCLSDEDPGVRAEAVRAMARLRHADVSSMMRPYLQASDPALVSAAVVALRNDPDQEIRAAAERALDRLMMDAQPEGRAEAAKALGHMDAANQGQALVMLLADSDHRVVRETIEAIRRRVAKRGPNPMYAPALIALLDHRRLKHEARAALVAFGEPVLPALQYFMNSAEERLWVRRALPKTIALIGGAHAAEALVASLVKATDPFLVRKLIEALQTLSAEMRERFSAEIGQVIEVQSRTYFESLIALTALGSTERGRLRGPLITWDAETYHPGLLEQLLHGRMAEAVTNVFGLLELIHESSHIRDARRSLLAGEPGQMVNAIEYLDNVLDPSLKRLVLAMVEDQPLESRLSAARSLFGLQVPGRQELLARYADQSLQMDGQENGWGAAALYEVYTTRAAPLYPRLEIIRRSESADPLSRETAEWIARRINLTAAQS